MLNTDYDLALRLGQAAYHNYWANPSTLHSHVQDLIECYQIILNNSTS
jgi:hypothetical protein